ncbi:UNC-50 family protein, partial [Opisthorchis viverrini]
MSSVHINVTDSLPRSVCTKMLTCSQPCHPGSMHRILSAAEKRSRYFRRLLKFKHMDFEYAFWQMAQLIFTPQRLFRNFQYRNCMSFIWQQAIYCLVGSRRQWARDDPAFLVLVFTMFLVSSIIFATFTLHTLELRIKFVLWVAFFDFFAMALLAATFFWIVTNRILIDRSGRFSSDLLSEVPDTQSNQDVEWAYAFDIHLNAVFPAALVYLLQLPLFYFILSDGLAGRFVGNTCWLIAALYYNYITFLGYSALPFLKRATVLLWPMTASVLLFIIATFVLQWNFTVFLWHLYRFRL